MSKIELKSKVEDAKQEEDFHVLAVDDSVIDRKLLERLLKVSSYRVTSVDSGDKALEYLGLLNNIENGNHGCSSSSPFSPPPQPLHQEMQGLKVNLIMTDYCMPGMSGYDLLKRLKGSAQRDIPVVVMSSENVPSRINMCLEGGAEEFLLKPVRLSDLKKLEPHLLKKPMDEFNSNSRMSSNNNNKRKSTSPNNETTEKRHLKRLPHVL
ncbi:hypothetical protein ACFE04_015563 [Oxalis oulophora]